MPSTRIFDAVHVPAASPGARPRVLVVLHGLGDSSRGFAFLPQALNLPELSYLMVNAPDPYCDGYSWYDFMGDPQPGIRRSREMLMRLLEELKAQGIAPADMFLFGFSQGCLMAVDAGLRSPDVLGGICGVSGYVGLAHEYPARLSPVARDQKFLITHGTGDTVVPFEPAARQFKALQDEGVDIEMKVYDKPHTILPEELADIREWFRGRLAIKR
jgi:phospholipase/carboxylesterase